jgi:hypothetical protein
MSPLMRFTREVIRNLGSARIREILLARLGERISFMIPHNLRHFLYIDLLNQLPSTDFVFLVDSRDVIFQLPPTRVAGKLASQGMLHFFLEDKRYFKNGKLQQIRHSDTNRVWIKKCLNNSTQGLESSESWIVNGGVIAGRVDSLLSYTEWAVETISKSLWKFDEILDQVPPILYASLHKNDERLVVHRNGQVVLNMCGVIDDEVFEREGSLLRCNEIIPIVHQWDRFGTYEPPVGLNLNRREFNVIIK